MRRPARCRLTLLAAIAALAAGCGAPLTVAQQLAGDWVGRPESAAERTVREWPTRAKNPDDPEIARAAAEAPATDLERLADVQVRLRLGERGKTRLELDGQPELTGSWKLVLAEGRRAVIDLTVAPGDGPEQTRRFEVEMLAEGEGFVLREQGADRQFGRLLFERPDAADPAGRQTATASAPGGPK